MTESADMAFEDSVLLFKTVDRSFNETNLLSEAAGNFFDEDDLGVCER